MLRPILEGFQIFVGAADRIGTFCFPEQFSSTLPVLHASIQKAEPMMSLLMPLSGVVALWILGRRKGVAHKSIIHRPNTAKEADI